MFHLDAVRRPAADYPERCAFPDPLTRLIEEERRQNYQERDESGQYRFYETEYILVATYLPPKEVYERLGTFFVRGAAIERGVVRAIDACIEQFEGAARGLEARLGALLTMERLTTAELLRHLHFTLTGHRHAIRVPDAGYSLNAYLADLRRAAPVLGQTAVTGGEIGGRPAAFARVTTSVTDRSERGIEVELMITVIEAPDSLVTVQTATRTPLSRSQATSLLKIARSVRVE